MFENGGFVGWREFYFRDVPPFVVNAVRVGGDGLFRGEAFDFQDLSVRKKFRVAAPIGIGRISLMTDPLGEEKISQLITDPAFGMAEAKFEGFGIFLLRQGPEIST